MMTIRKRALHLTMLCAILLITACGGGDTSNKQGTGDNPPIQDDMHPVKAIDRGEIIQTSNNSLLITTFVDKGADSYVDAISFQINDQTELLSKNEEVVTLDQLTVGAQVEAWHTGVVAESYPAQATAVKIVLLDDENSVDTTINRAEAIRIALNAQTEVNGPWAVKQAKLDEGNEFWLVEIVDFQYMDQPVTVRIDSKSGEIVPIVAAENDVFRLYSPQAHEELGPTFTVEGEARVFEAAFSWVLEDGHNILAEGHEMTNAGAPEWGKFKFDVSFEHATQPNMMLILYVSSAKDGSSEHQLIIPLKVPETLIKYSADQ